ncbi:PRAME family member 8-like isoform X3 [Rattus norvegicus]|uniref:PRAME family member 8-like isoform X3 n=1 Tax=Rattus norvegicus TaxID=10116 RepID=UPI001916CCF7|nr:PRAME family member 8-like isoform X3 [Rattus norvegicus]
MSGHTPPTLEKLARQTLLRNEAMAISCLGELPTILFPALFKEAFEGRHINLIKEMVAAWPFPCLPVGALMKTPNGETMKALLDGVDMRLTRTFHPKYLMTPLETLSVTCYIISQNDLDSFSCSQSLFHLKHLELIGVLLYGLDVMPLRGLLEKVADTLETLNLQWCGMKDPQLYALLPALRNCSQLTTVKFYSNKFSMPILKDLLQHTANWSQVNVEQYPAPLECYDDSSQVSVARFSQLCRELTDTHRAIRQPKNISFATEICYTCGKRCVYHNGPRLCCCWQ